MKNTYLTAGMVLVFILGSIIWTGQAFADKPHKNENERYEKHQNREMRQGDHGQSESYNRNNHDRHEDGDRRDSHDKYRHRHFSEQQRLFIQDYYSKQYRRGNCPPGLARKHNGCMPPGQAKKWGIGKRLPRDVIFHDLPHSIAVHLGPPPTHHRYVRVAQDILLITVGTGMVVDAIDDLNWEFGR